MKASSRTISVIRYVGSGSARPIIPWLLLVLAGCTTSRPLMPTPSIYLQGQAPLFETLPEEVKSASLDLLYFTDRTRLDDLTGSPLYGYGRSSSAAFGSVEVIAGGDLDWNQVVSSSLDENRRKKGVTLSIGAVEELGRFPETPLGVVLNESGLVETDPEILAAVEESEASLFGEIDRRLDLTTKNEIFIFIHGYANDFSEGAFKLAELWHFLGREGVPLLFSWPAGRGGPTGYAYDIESGNFCLFHLKELLRLLARHEEVEAIHIIAHSRGTDVATNALRELVIEGRAAGQDPRARLKVRNLVLAAPDLDMSVVEQRLIAEKTGLGIERVTIYTSQGDKAIRLSEKLRSGLRRLGRVGAADLPEERADDVIVWQRVTNIDFVDFEGKSDRHGHSYFLSNPNASSDLVMLLRFGYAPGDDNGRPLEYLGAGFWRIPDGYPPPSE
jgi:esterase/lipase superfamily enzyme